MPEMPFVKDLLEDNRIIQTYNGRKKDYKKHMYIAVLALAKEQPYDGWNTPIEGFNWFQVKQLYRVAKDWSMELPDYTRAVPYLTELARSEEKYVIQLPRQEKVGHPFAVTDRGYQFIISSLEALRDLLERRMEFETMNLSLVRKQTRPSGFTSIYLEPQKSPLTFGRLELNDWCFSKDKAMSRRHARITFHDNSFWIEDLSSTNGTWRIDESLPSGREGIEIDKVRDKSVYQLGNTQIQLLISKDLGTTRN
jgi:hypothetical protein